MFLLQAFIQDFMHAVLQCYRSVVSAVLFGDFTCVYVILGECDCLVSLHGSWYKAAVVADFIPPVQHATGSYHIGSIL